MFSNVFAQNNDIIEIQQPWTEKKDNTIRIAIINDADLSEEKILIIRNVIESEEYYVKNGQIFFEGWTGALQFVDSTNTKFEITVYEKKNNGDIVLELLEQKNPTHNGWTTSYYVDNQITSASIQIFDANSLSVAELENLVRHEIGHALGLAHATSENDLMYELIGSDQKFISNCSLEGLKFLNNGYGFTEVNCPYV